MIKNIQTGRNVTKNPAIVAYKLMTWLGYFSRFLQDCIMTSQTIVW